MTVQAVIFDLDGVITDTATYHFKAWQKLAMQIGIPLTPEDNEPLKGLDRLSSLNKILQKGGLTVEEPKKQFFAEQKNLYYKTFIESMTQKDIFPGAEYLLQQLRQKNVRVGLASASQNALVVLKRLGIEHYFDYIADAGQIKLNKPHPDIFLTVASHLNVEPNACVGIEDACAGIQSIKAAGMVAIGIGDEAQLLGADKLYPSIAELKMTDILSF